MLKPSCNASSSSVSAGQQPGEERIWETWKTNLCISYQELIWICHADDVSFSRARCGEAIVIETKMLNYMSYLRPMSSRHCATIRPSFGKFSLYFVVVFMTQTKSVLKSLSYRLCLKNLRFQAELNTLGWDHYSKLRPPKPMSYLFSFKLDNH